jgi:hypothetical protein
MQRWTRRIQGWLPSPAPDKPPGRGDGWQSLRNPVPGHSIIDGVPVAVVAVRRHSQSGQLEVVRGLHPTTEWPGASAPPDAKRHVIPALSFNPHPRRELLIDGRRFFYGTVSNAVSCADCGSNDNGFGFVNTEAPVAGAGQLNGDHMALCERCAENRARVAGR